MAEDWTAVIVDIQPQGTVTLLDYLKDYLDITDDNQDAALGAALNMAGPTIETYLDRVVAKRLVTEYFPHHFGTVELHNMPVDVGAGVTVTLDGDAQTGFELFLYRGQTAFLTRGKQRQDYPMDWRVFEQVEVQYTAGYDPLPVDMANGIIWTAGLIYQGQGSGNIPGGSGTGEVKSMTIYDVGSISYDVGSSGSSGGDGGYFGSPGIIPDAAAQTLMRYKRMAA